MNYKKIARELNYQRDVLRRRHKRISFLDEVDEWYATRWRLRHKEIVDSLFRAWRPIYGSIKRECEEDA